MSVECLKELILDKCESLRGVTLDRYGPGMSKITECFASVEVLEK